MKNPVLIRVILLLLVLFGIGLFVTIFSASILRENLGLETLSFKPLCLTVVIYLIIAFFIMGLFIRFKVIAPIEQKTKEVTFKLYNDNITKLKNMNALENDIKGVDFVNLALIDIISFDDINELYGFSSGNLVLIEASKILEDYSKLHDFEVYRVHGNTFAILDRKNPDFMNFSRCLTEISNLFKTKSIYIKGDINAEMFLDVTIGVSFVQDEPLKTATIALKNAKRNYAKISAYNSELDGKALIEKSNYWREKIKKAIENDNITPFYQGIVNKNQEIVKYETLVRIKDIKDDGTIDYILPYHFLDIAIKSKQYESLVNALFSKSFDDIENKIKDKAVSLNLSYRDILSTSFNDFLENRIEALSQENRDRIVFEILESVNISDYSILGEFVNRYRRMGIKIAIDDFGSGYSNFAHIIKLKPDYLKIDSSLVKDIHTNKNSYEMIKSIVDFSKALNIKTIAEYVHCKEVFDVVRELGVDEFQGFYFAEPKTFD